jgi:hypothetical protein
MPPVSAAVMRHMDRIEVGEERRAAEAADRPTGMSAAEQHAARVLPGYRADAALREEARRRELAARGLLVDEADIEEEDEEEPDVEVDQEPEEPERGWSSTAERYAAVALAGDNPEGRSARQASRNIAARAVAENPLDRYLGKRRAGAA